MNLKQLETLKQVDQSQRNSFKQGVDQQIELGYTHLVKAVESESFLQQKEFLLKAFDHFSQGLRFQRNSPEPYMGLAYVMLFSGKRLRAEAYYHKARQITAQNPELDSLFAAIEQTRILELNPLIQDSEPPFKAMKALDSDDHFDVLYDQIELSLDHLLQTIRKTLPDFVATTKAALCTQQASILTKLTKKVSEIYPLLEDVEREIECGELRNSLKTVENTLKQLDKTFKISQQMLSLSEQIQAQIDQLTQLQNELETGTQAEDLPIIEENLEILLDQSDHFADQIDALESHGHPVQELLVLYQNMSKKFESFEENVQDLQDSFAKKPQGATL